MKKLLIILISSCMLVCLIGSLVACDDTNTPTWYSDNGAPAVELGKTGDFYYDTENKRALNKR